VLSQPAKRNPRRLCFAAGWVLVMHMVDMYWIIMPQMQVNRKLPLKFSLHGFDFLILISFFGILAYLFLRSLPRHCLYPVRDARLMDSIQLKN
jgi:hypothetical protein